jgi:hypothetical protein
MNTLSVETFNSQGSRADSLLQYPYVRPAGSFLTDGLVVAELPANFSEFSEAADAYLVDAQLPLLSKRVPIVSYGANSNPAQLARKMAGFDNDASAYPELQTLPHVTATIPGAAVVWHGKPNQKGSAFAELYKSEATQNQEATCHLAFMTLQQLALAHATEGITYHLAPVLVQAGHDRMPLEAYAYVAGHSTVLLKDNQPVPVKRHNESGSPKAMSAEEAVTYMLTAINDTAPTARALIAELDGLPLETRKARQRSIASRLGELGLNKSFCFHTTANAGFIGRADLNFTAGVYHLAEQVVDSLRPTDKELRHTKYDIAHQLRRRAHYELADLLHHE